MFAGVSLLLVGSGLYWLLSSVLIRSFTTLSPGLFAGEPFGVLAVLILGLACCGVGALRFSYDMRVLEGILLKRGLILSLLLPLLSILDVGSTSYGISLHGSGAELNALVAGAYSAGVLAFTTFTISYVLLTTGLTVLILNPAKPRIYALIGFPIVSGVASFGPLFNILRLTMISVLGTVGVVLVAVAFSALLGFSVHKRLKGQSEK